MGKSLSVRIAQRAKKKKLSTHAQKRSIFLAVRTDVEQALDDGWSIKSIWKTLYEEKKITFGYQTFRRYINELILAVKTETTHLPILKETNKKKQIPSQIPSFIFQSTLDKKDLL